jgi:hypothetical protein
MAFVGRNDLCPCGSGQKYKKCCLSKSAPSADEVFRRRLDESRNDLIKKILKHAGKVYGPAAIEEAWVEFHQGDSSGGFDPDSIELQLFVPWFFYDWTPDPNEQETQVYADAPRHLPPALSLLETSSFTLDPLQIDYIEQCAQTGFSFYEILEAWPGKGFKATDVLTGEMYDIVEKLGSANAKPGSLVFGKAVTINELTTMEASSPIMIPPAYKVEVLKLRQHLEKLNSPIDHDTLWEYDPEIQSLYQRIYQALIHPKMPAIMNTDGDLLIPHRLTFEIESPVAAFDALASLCVTESKDELLKSATFENDKLVFIEFSWDKLGNSNHAGWDNIVLGSIKIDPNRLVIEVNSEKRADDIDAIIKERLKEGCKLLSRMVEPIDGALKNGVSEKSKPLDDASRDQLMNDPEIQAKIAQMMKAHWDQWIFEKIPALDNKTPVEAVKTPDGREALEALLAQFEQDAESGTIPGQGVEIFHGIRDRLGL